MRIVLEPSSVTFIDDVGEEIYYNLAPEQFRYALSCIHDRSYFSYDHPGDEYRAACDYFHRHLKDACRISEQRKKDNRARSFVRDFLREWTYLLYRKGVECNYTPETMPPHVLEEVRVEAHAIVTKRYTELDNAQQSSQGTHQA
jgi:hypothetical protein